MGINYLIGTFILHNVLWACLVICCCLHLQALSSEANELLPVYNKNAIRQYANPLQTHDWSSQGGATPIRHFSYFPGKDRYNGAQ